MAEASGRCKLAGLFVVAALGVGIGQPVSAQTGADPVPLIVTAGTPLSVALDAQVPVRRLASV